MTDTVPTMDGEGGPDRPATPPFIRVRGLSKRFGAIQALSGIDVDIQSGRIHGLVGANGAGKSTLVKILAGIEHPDDGNDRAGWQSGGDRRRPPCERARHELHPPRTQPRSQVHCATEHGPRPATRTGGSGSSTRDSFDARPTLSRNEFGCPSHSMSRWRPYRSRRSGKSPSVEP